MSCLQVWGKLPGPDVWLLCWPSGSVICLNKKGYLMQWPEIGWEVSQKPWRSLPSVPWTFHQCSISLNNSFKFSLSVLVQLLWLLFFPDRCFSVKGVVAKFPESLVLFHPFPEGTAGCSSCALRYNLMYDFQEHWWASAPFASALKSWPQKGL